MIQIIKHVTRIFFLILNNSWVKEETELEIAYSLELKTTFIKKLIWGKIYFVLKRLRDCIANDRIWVARSFFGNTLSHWLAVNTNSC